MLGPSVSPTYLVLLVAPDGGPVSESERVLRSVASTTRRVTPDRLIDVVRSDPAVSIVILGPEVPGRIAVALGASLHALEPTLPVLRVADPREEDPSPFPAEWVMTTPLQPQKLRVRLEQLSGLDVYSAAVVELLRASTEGCLRRAFAPDATVAQVFLRNNRRPLGTVTALIRFFGPEISATVAVAGAPEPFRAMRQRLLPEMGRGAPQVHDLAAEIANHVAQPIKNALEEGGFQISRDPPVTSLDQNLRDELAEQSLVARAECPGGPVYLQMRLVADRPIRIGRDTGPHAVPGEVRFL